MGILSNIFSKIFPSRHPANQKTGQGAPAQANTAGAGAAIGAGAGAAGAAGASAGTAGAQAAPRPAAPAPQAAPMDMVDVEAILNDKARQASQALNWRSSIVDLLKLLDLDSSLQARKELAQELNYSGDMGDSATMNIWLHRQVMNRLAANGGKVPADLRD